MIEFLERSAEGEAALGERGHQNFGVWALVALFVLNWTLGSYGQLPQPPRSKILDSIQVEKLEEAIQAGEYLELRLRGELFIIDLKNTQLHSKSFAASAVSSDSKSPAIHFEQAKNFKGQLVDDPNSIVRFSLSSTGLKGYIKSEEGWLFIEPDSSSLESHVITYDSEIDPNFSGACQSPGAEAGLIEDHSHSGHSHDEEVEDGDAQSDPSVRGQQREAEEDDFAWLPNQQSSDSGPQEAGSLQVLELAVDADYEYYQRYGAGSVAQIEALFNEIDGIFQTELGIQIELVEINVHTSVDDPYTTNDAGDLLVEFKDHWESSNDSIPRDLTHLMSGKNLSGSTVGIAYTSVLCHPSFGYGLTQDLNSPLTTIVVAHELGHNLGANHDASGSSPKYIMYPSVSSSNLDEFSLASKGEIETFAGGTSCLSQASSGGGGSTPSGGGGGGGGGPVDPVLLLLVAIWAAVIFRARKTVLGQKQ